MRRPAGRPRPTPATRGGRPFWPSDHRLPKRARKGGSHPLDAVVLPERRVPRRVVAHLGPANSGKTHAGLEALIAAGSGAYAAPLRMLANEAYSRLAERLGPERVGLVTGEERINERAPVIACTVEMLPPARRGIVVLDEVHWAADPERGSAWTRVLWHSGADELYLAGAPDAEPLLAAAYGDALEIVWTERLTGPLTLVGGVDIARLEAASVVVAFSRAAVIALASRIHAVRGGKVGVLYGAMPVAARRHQIEQFVAGMTEVLVSTDVLGHGVEPPVPRRALRRDDQVRRDRAAGPARVGGRPDRRTCGAFRPSRGRLRRLAHRPRLAEAGRPGRDARAAADGGRRPGGRDAGLSPADAGAAGTGPRRPLVGAPSPVARRARGVVPRRACGREGRRLAPRGTGRPDPRSAPGRRSAAAATPVAG